MKISGFTYGIEVFSFLGPSGNNRLENNVVTDSYYGVYIASSQFNVLRNNRLKDNTHNLAYPIMFKLTLKSRTYT